MHRLIEDAHLSTAPKGLVSVLGLKPTTPVHSVVWATLNDARGSDDGSVPLNYVLAESPAKVFPKRKDKPHEVSRLTDEIAEPAGILKARWMSKHMFEVPSVVVVFFELEWEDPAWDSRREQCSRLLQSLREASGGRATKLVVVLLQDHVLPEGHPICEARAPAFRTACGLNAKHSLFVLHKQDPSLRGTVARLEAAFLESSKQYYGEAIAHVRSRLDALNQHAEQMLVTRYLFKMAFFCELKQERRDALRDYKLAYAQVRLLNERIEMLREVKVVAGIIDAKICILSFRLDAPLDALGQFREHISFFRNAVGVANVAFQHDSWMAAEHYLFAEIFSTALQGQLKPVATAHPGFYYRLAAQYTRDRKRRAEALIDQARVREVAVKELPTVYYGQTHYDVQQLPAKLTEEEKRLFPIFAIERAFPYSDTIISLYSRAQEEFRQVNTIVTNRNNQVGEMLLHRMVNFIGLDMAMELMSVHQYDHASKLLEAAVAMYRDETWPLPLSVALAASLRCACALGDARLYAMRALELSGKHPNRSQKERARAQRGLMRVLAGEVPEPEKGVAADTLAALWTPQRLEQSVDEHGVLAVNMTKLANCIDCKVCFQLAAAASSQVVTLFAALRSHLPTAIQFHSIALTFSNGAYNDAKILVDGQPANSTHTLEPDTVKVLTITFPSLAPDEHVLRCRNLALRLGTSKFHVVLTWELLSRSLAADGRTQAINAAMTAARLAQLPYEKWSHWPKIRIHAHPSRIQIGIAQSLPAAVNERFPITVNVTNGEAVDVRRMQLKLSLQHTSATAGARGGFLGPNDAYTATLVFNVDCIKAGEQLSWHVNARFEMPFEGKITAVVEYEWMVASGELSITASRHKELSEPFSAVEPFEVTMKCEPFMTNRTHSRPWTDASQNTLWTCKIRSLVPWPLTFRGLLLGAADSQPSLPLFAQDTALGSGEVMEESVVLPAAQTAGRTFRLEFLRGESGVGERTVKLYDSPARTLDADIVTVKVVAPSVGRLGKLLLLQCEICNRTPTLQEVEVVVEPCEMFVVSGYQRMRLRLAPNVDNSPESRHTVRLNLYPLVTGDVTLPTIKARDLRNADKAPFSTVGQSAIFIMPEMIGAN
eukprot:m.143074 g.143074  ORF g.143074 m.143074 type:complete len:1113 (-) comp16731_c1_seq1:222-3560(-)